MNKIYINPKDSQMLTRTENVYEATFAAWLNDKSHQNAVRLIPKAERELNHLADQCQHDEAKDIIWNYVSALKMHLL